MAARVIAPPSQAETCAEGSSTFFERRKKMVQAAMSEAMMRTGVKASSHQPALSFNAAVRACPRQVFS